MKRIDEGIDNAKKYAIPPLTMQVKTAAVFLYESLVLTNPSISPEYLKTTRKATIEGFEKILSAMLPAPMELHPDDGSLLDVAREIVHTYEEWETRPVCSYGQHIVGRIRTLEDLKLLFPSRVADINNWCFFGCSGVHGDHEMPDTLFLEDDEAEHKPLTVLVVQPRHTRMFFGTISVTREDIPFMLKLWSTTLLGVLDSQNSPHETIIAATDIDEEA